MKLLNRLLKGEAGQVLPLALILLVLGGLLVVPTLSLMSTNLNANRQIDTANSELYAADAGVEEVMWNIKYVPGFQLPAVGGQKPVLVPQINGTTVTAVLSRPVAGQPYRITSIAVSPGGHSTTVVCSLDVSGSSDLWDYALASLGGDIILFGNSETYSDEVLNGNIYSNDDISVSGNAEVRGDASVVDDISTSANGEIKGTQTEGALPLVPVTIDTAAYKTQAQNIGCGAISCAGGSCPSSNWCQTFGSPISCTSSTTISGCSPTFNAPVCINGDLTIQGNSTSPTFNQPVKITGNLTIQPNGGTVTFNNIVCVTGTVTLGGNSSTKFLGPVSIGGNLTEGGNTSMQFGSTCFIGGNLAVNGNTDVPLGDTLYIVGSLTLGGNGDLVGGTHVFVENGDISLQGNTTLTADKLPFIMAIHGDVTVTGNSNPVSAIIYAPEGDIVLQGNCQLIGCAVGKTVTGSGNSKVEYLMDLRDRSDLPGREDQGPGGGLGLQIHTYTIQ